MPNNFNDHTPLPWKVYYAKNNGQLILGTGELNGCAIQAHNGTFWRDHDEARNNAEFVVHACNNHYEMLDELKRLVDTADECLTQNVRNSEGVEAWISNARRVIKKAEGK